MSSIIRREINLPTTGTVVTGVSGKKIRVLALFAAVNNGVSTWKFQSNPQTATGPDEEFQGAQDLTGNVYLASSATDTGLFVLPYNPNGWFECRESDDLLGFQVGSTGAGIGGSIICDLVDSN